ncbi:type ISP restriction/modification enzyme [Kocuria sp. PD6]|uniref:DEAD/DEAH box helicase n=1 Tax=Kocuria sp. PD6 TaxID=2962590 RepID=UPI002881CBB5|nr:type ISP restriction/modification enzyme [Kocuria sp. PD6]MDT0120851.1 type ISP restriction/modification enzyme [Kocuria sp. PD6]
MTQDAFGELLDKLYYGALDTRDRGDKFERLMRSYLLTDRAYSFSKVWLWNEYPERGNRSDIGVDLVGVRADTGEKVAIQCKFKDPDKVIAKGDVDSFISASATAEFGERLMVSTSRKELGGNARKTIENLDKPWSTVGLDQLANAPIDWSQFNLDQPEHMVRTDEGKSPRPHQLQAMAAVKEGFESHDRGKLIMACGTGKTYTSLQIMREQTPENATVLFLVPSISLLSQTLTEWKRDASEEFRAFAVCSDVKVGKNTADDISSTDLALPATTSPERLITQLNRFPDYAGRTVVFSTYQSIDVLHEAQQMGFPDFDLIVCDEAHRTTGATLAGQEDSAFVRVHDQSFIRGAKRLYMTATPRVFDESTRKKAEENSVVVASMDDETLFGPEFHLLGFGEAVEGGLLSDYKVLVLAVDEAAITRQFQELLTDEDGQLSIDDVARMVGCWKGLSTRGSTQGGMDDDAAPHPGAPGPMRRAVAFASNIRESQRVADALERVSEQLAQDNPQDLLLRAEHVDGTMNVAQRGGKLRWLEAEPEQGECRILTNARCLSEGVDVPSLDAVMFLNPRNSQVDVVQSVGRVMRRAKDKDYGYIILPVGIPSGVAPEAALKDSKKYKVIWSVLNALRSHDDRFEAMVNHIDLNQDRDDRLDVIPVTVDDDSTVVVPTNEHGEQTVLDLPFENAQEWRDAIYAKIVQKVGDREYWENWSATIAEVAAKHTERITALVTQDPAPEVAEQFDTFVTALRANLNDGISVTDAISMLSQHLITKPVFDALFEGYDFAAHNPVSVVMQRMVDTLAGNNLESETATLQSFYDSVQRRATGIDNPEGKQRIITELYENFFTKAFPKQADAMGIVYTPVEIVDFILRSVNELSRRHFGVGLTDRDVHVLDPFTGTGTFMVRLIESGIIEPHDLARKYAEELHATEIMLLAYYIAAINIEATYHGVQGGMYVPFEGIVLGDTFQMSEDKDVIDSEVFTGNNSRAQKQLDADIRVIVGNPPYSVGQTSANDNNANLAYPTLDARIRDTYAALGSGQNKNSLYDSYVRAMRWGSDRIGDRGILAYVTNGGYIDGNSADGIRKSLVTDFDRLYVFNLRGNQRTAGEQSRKEGGKVFGSGSRATVAVLLAVKDPAHTGDCELRYRDIGDYLSREAKLEIIRTAGLNDEGWQTLEPNAKGEWLNQSTDEFQEYAPLGAKNENDRDGIICRSYSAGLKSGRDSWCYNYSARHLANNMRRIVTTFNATSASFDPTGRTAGEILAQAKKHADYDPTKMSWNRGTLNDLARRRKYTFDEAKIVRSAYRPFSKQHLYFDRSLNDMLYRMPSMFPAPEHENYGFYLTGVGSHYAFTLLATDAIPDLHLLDTGQFFPRYTYEPLDTPTGNENPAELNLGLGGGESCVVVGGYRRLDNVTDETLARYTEAFGEGVSKDEIFASVYAQLHDPAYRAKYAADLKRQLPRIPLPGSVEDFRAYAAAGRELMDLHIGYETVDPYPLTESHSTGDESDPAFYRVTTMRWGGTGRSRDRSVIVYNGNVTLSGIPGAAHEYMLGSRSGLEWLLDRYRVKTDKASGIVNDPNDWALEHENPATSWTSSSA